MEYKIIIKPENKMCKRRRYCKQTEEQIKPEINPVLLKRHFPVFFRKEPEAQIEHKRHGIKENIIGNEHYIIKPQICR